MTIDNFLKKRIVNGSYYTIAYTTKSMTLEHGYRVRNLFPISKKFIPTSYGFVAYIAETKPKEYKPRKRYNRNRWKV